MADTCKLPLPLDSMDMETNTSNKGKGDDIIKKFYWK